MKRILSIVLVFFLLCGCSPKSVEENNLYMEDARYLVTVIEDTHPCFILDNVPEGYEAAKAEYLESAKGAKDDEKFYEITSKYCASLKDGHTGISIGEVGDDAHVLQVQWYSDGKDLYLCDENNVPTDVQVLKIGSVDVQNLFDVIDIYQVMENDNARERYYRVRSKQAYMLEYAGLDCDFKEPVVLILDNGETLNILWEKIDTSITHEEMMKSNTISWEMIGDVFYIDHDLCSAEDPELETVFKALEQAVLNGTTKVIYDVRGNSGGNVGVCKNLLQALDMVTPSIGAVVRLSDLYLQNQSQPSSSNRKPTGEIYEVVGSLTSLPNDEIELLVLSDDVTYSAAMDLCIWVQDGKLGKVVGRGSSNKPNHYGAVVPIKLPNLGWEGQISTAQWTRPDPAADPDQIQPDVKVPYGTDALKVALELLSNE